MDIRSFLKGMRLGNHPSSEEFDEFIKGVTNDSVSSAQIAAFTMATCIHGLDEIRRLTLTAAMRDSGDIMRWDLSGPILDKHSTGGIGDCTSLVLAPALAACGAFVPMVSGRGLGHAGGTLDSLRSIPGLNVELDAAHFRTIVENAGCAIVSATQEIAPADRKIFAIRDVTSTVESVDLITASILSKKLATGIEGLVLDVKYGSGAFMKSAGAATGLARTLVSTANKLGCRCSALVTDMNQPLARALGGALELREAMKVLTGDFDNRLSELSCNLGGVLLRDAGLAESEEAGAILIRDALSDGRAAETFGKMVLMMGGPADFVENWTRIVPEAPVIKDVLAPAAGFVSTIDGEALGLAVVGLGGGRSNEVATIDRAVGFDAIARIGTPVTQGDLLARVHAADEAAAEKASNELLSTFTVSQQVPTPSTLVFKRIDATDYS